MTKYQLEHFKDKVHRQFQPYIEEQELIVKQFRTEAIDHAVKGLAKKMGADKVLSKLKEAEKKLADARATARTFFEKKKPKEQELNYNLRVANRYGQDDFSVADCEEQLRDWAKSLADRQIEKRAEGKKLKQLRDAKQQAIDTVMEAGCPEELIKQLGWLVSQSIGLTWNKEVKRIAIE